ncbi:hypothetical protein F511_40075 [Dorcoceras hygrometricum]|uniref:Uncharacterized protein n=1 Tax=Dorcoceras hygrometricum TaxID=472368 RepID=A0A2Z7BN68_9LAMI|nr:hypothetical protein F511_40075 [Dorcoceras hygrometricum]
MVWMRCLNGPREQASNIMALDEKNRAKLIKDKPSRPEGGQLREEKTGSRDLVKLDAYDRDEADGRMISVRSLTSSSASCKIAQYVAAGVQAGSVLRYEHRWKASKAYQFDSTSSGKTLEKPSQTGALPSVKEVKLDTRSLRAGVQWWLGVLVAAGRRIGLQQGAAGCRLTEKGGKYFEFFHNAR